MIQIDMDMPKSCDVCDFKEEVNGKLYCGNPVGMIKGEYVDDCIMTRHEDCPLSEPEQIWNPVSKTIEIPEYEIIACDKYNEQMMGYLFCNDGQWICESEHEIMYDVVAWAEKLEPYKGENDE